MKARTSAALVILVVAVLAAYMTVRAVALIATGQLKGIGLGIGVLMLVVVGIALLIGEVAFGRATERLGRRLEQEGALPAIPPEAARLPSGRLTRDAADALFAEREAVVQAAPQDWRAWFALATAYGDARDPARGRKAMRRAISLERDGHVRPIMDPGMDGSGPD